LDSFETDSSSSGPVSPAAAAARKFTSVSKRIPTPYGGGAPVAGTSSGSAAAGGSGAPPSGGKRKFTTSDLQVSVPKMDPLLQFVGIKADPEEPIPSTSSAAAAAGYHDPRTSEPLTSPIKYKDAGVQVDDCQQQDSGLYPVGGTCAGDVIKPEAAMLYDDMKQRLECPVCCKISLPPVMQCRNGHVTCNNCRIKVRSCPMCREVDIDIRNLFAEKAVSYMTITCEFSHYGCKVEMPYRDRDLHQRVCKHRPYNCPYIECEHKFVAADVVPHVSTAHRDDCRNSEGPEITASMILIGNFFGGDGAWSPRVITCFGRTFFDVALTRDRWLHHWVWLLGEEDEAQNFIYEITAFKGNIKYLYAGEVASLRTPDEEIVSTGQCLSISDPIGKRLRDGDKIRYKLKLSRKDHSLSAINASGGSNGSSAAGAANNAAAAGQVSR